MEVAQLEPTPDTFGPFHGRCQSLAVTLEVFTIDAVTVHSSISPTPKYGALYQLFWGGLMEFLRRQLLHIVMTAVALPAVSSMAWAQTDRRAVNLLVGFAAGSSADIIARLLAEQVNKAQGLTMFVQNLPGAG